MSMIQELRRTNWFISDGRFREALFLLGGCYPICCAWRSTLVVSFDAIGWNESRPVSSVIPCISKASWSLGHADDKSEVALLTNIMLYIASFTFQAYKTARFILQLGSRFSLLRCIMPFVDNNKITALVCIVVWTLALNQERENRISQSDRMPSECLDIQEFRL